MRGETVLYVLLAVLAFAIGFTTLALVHLLKQLARRAWDAYVRFRRIRHIRMWRGER